MQNLIDILKKHRENNQICKLALKKQKECRVDYSSIDSFDMLYIAMIDSVIKENSCDEERKFKDIKELNRCHNQIQSEYFNWEFKSGGDLKIEGNEKLLERINAVKNLYSKSNKNTRIVIGSILAGDFDIKKYKL